MTRYVQINEKLARELHEALGYELGNITTPAAPVVPTPPVAETPTPVDDVLTAKPVPDDLFAGPDANGVQWWPFLAKLANRHIPVPSGVIAKFARDQLREEQKAIVTESQLRAIEMNTGANASLRQNRAYTIVESNGVWDRMFGNVKYRTGDLLEGVIAFQDQWAPNVPMTAEIAKAILRGRVKRMERSPNLRHFQWLTQDDYRAGL